MKNPSLNQGQENQSSKEQDSEDQKAEENEHQMIIFLMHFCFAWQKNIDAINPKK